MSLSFDPDRQPLPIGHFIGDRLIPAGDRAGDNGAAEGYAL